MAKQETLFEKVMKASVADREKRERLIASKKNTRPARSKRLTEGFDEEEIVSDEEVMPDTVDDVIVVTDPELTPDDVADRAAELQDIVDGTPEGETPEIKDYVDDYLYTCPICANTFNSESEMNPGDVCPVCDGTPEAFILAGEIEEADGLGGDEMADDDIADIPAEEPAPEDDLAEIEPEEEEDLDEGFTPYALDEKTFNPFLQKFIKDNNYRQIKKFEIVNARLGKNLTLEANITYKSGKSKKVNIVAENFKPKAQMQLQGKVSNVFGIVEGKTSGRAPFIFKTRMHNNVIRCEGLDYNFNATVKVEGAKKTANIAGKLIVEKRNRK